MFRRLLIRDVRKQTVKWGLYCVAREHKNPFAFIWREVRPFTIPQRYTFMHRMLGRSWVGDCSAAVILLYWLAGGRDPSGNNFSGAGNTTSFLEHGKEITEGEVQVGDIIVYADVHAVLVVSTTTSDFLCFSHGQPGDPHLVRNSVLMGLGTPHYLRFSTLNRRLR